MNSDPDEEYIELAEECHTLLENISEFFASDLLAIDEEEITLENVERIALFRDKLKGILASPIK